MLNAKLQTKKFDIYLPLAIALITMAVFSPVLWYDFVNLDDPIVVYSNRNIQSGLTIDAIGWALTSEYVSNWVPLTWISHMLDVQLFGMNPAGHHFVNDLFHVASSVLLFLFLKKATRAPLKSAAVALLFALHPLHVESVAWVAERKDVLSAFFWMLALYAYVLYTEKPGIARYLTVLGLFALGLLSKPMIVTLPVVLLLIDWWPLGRFSLMEAEKYPARRSPWLRLIIEKIPFLLLSACVSVITYLVKQTAGEIVTDHAFPERVARACVSYLDYLYKMIWPANLAVFYPYVESPPSLWVASFAVLSLALITFIVFRMRNHYPFLITGWFWYIVALLPVIGLVRIGDFSLADRYTYIPLIGPFVMTAWGISQLTERWQFRREVRIIISAVAFFVIISLTSMQLHHWKNSFTLLTHTIDVTEDNWMAHNNLGVYFLGEGRIEEAIAHFKESLRVKPSNVPALLNMGAAYTMVDENVPAIDAFKRVLQVEPGNQKAHLALGFIYVKTGDKDLALAEYWMLQSSGSPFSPYLLNEINAMGRS